jgi:hypothetical protein
MLWRSRLLAFLILTAIPGLGWGWVNPSDGPIDPVLPFVYTQAQVMFEQAPPSLVAACDHPARQKFWILGKTTRPEGDYLLISGPVWVDEGAKGKKPHKNVLVDDDEGQIVLLDNAGACLPRWLPEMAFNGIFPGRQSRAQNLKNADIIKSLARDEVARAERIFGGGAAFLQAFDAAGGADSQFAALSPVLDAMRGHTLPQPRLIPAVAPAAAPSPLPPMSVAFLVRHLPSRPWPDFLGAMLALAIYLGYRRTGIKKWLSALELHDFLFRCLGKKRVLTYLPPNALLQALNLPQTRKNPHP